MVVGKFEQVFLKIAHFCNSFIMLYTDYCTLWVFADQVTIIMMYQKCSYGTGWVVIEHWRIVIKLWLY